MAPDPTVGYLWGTPFTPLPHIERAMGLILNVKGLGNTAAARIRAPTMLPSDCTFQTRVPASRALAPLER